MSTKNGRKKEGSYYYLCSMERKRIMLKEAINQIIAENDNVTAT